jgi:DNA polymerase lambda
LCPPSLILFDLGGKIAAGWVASGCRTLDDLRKGKNGVTLTIPQQIGLKYYDGMSSSFIVIFYCNIVDINSRMPREETKAIFDKIKPIGILASLRVSSVLMRLAALKIDPKLFVEIMGSYRR